MDDTPNLPLFLICLALLLLALSLSGCADVWGAAYHQQGGFGKTYEGKARYITPTPFIKP
jgi:uncharacterized protein YceK